MTPSGPILGVDYGTKRIGLAVSDPEGRMAFPLKTLIRKNLRQDLDAIRALADERDVGHIVVGLPLHMDGRRGPEAAAAEGFADRLHAATGRSVEMVDERLTSVEAERALRETGRTGRRGREVVDAVAASLLLRTWLETHS